MRHRAKERFVASPQGEAVIGLLAQWWVDAEGVFAPRDSVDHRADAARLRYTTDQFLQRLETVSGLDRGGVRSARTCFDGFTTWACSYAARQVCQWLRSGLARPVDPLGPHRVRPRVQREITDAITTQFVAERGARAEKFDPDADLTTVVERGRATMMGDFG